VLGLIELIDPGRVGSRVHNLPVLAAQCPDGDTEAVVAMGGDRVALGQGLERLGWVLSTLVHPLAAVSPSAHLGPGTVIGPLAVIGAAVQIGAHGLVGRGSTIGHHATLDDGVVVNPGANIGGNTTLGKRAQRMVRAGVRFGMLPEVVYDYFPSLLWDTPVPN
jgi:acetyltransferase-like isoleucine patch superfamily enzyme